jgi:hypothetical protein
MSVGNIVRMNNISKEKCILSIDVGIKNLSMCAMSGSSGKFETYNIHLWDTFNTIGCDGENAICETKQKNGKICGKKCTYKNKNETGECFYYCKLHFPKNLEISDKKYKIIIKKVDSYLLQDIAKTTLSKVQEIYNTNIGTFDSLTGIIIELQPKINQKMKFVSHIIYGKLVELMSEKNISIRFVRASQKLKCYKGPFIECKLKGEYAKRKWLSIQYMKYFLENNFDNTVKDKWLPILLSHSKKDDLSDTGLFCINALNGMEKKQTRQKNGKCIK